MVISVLVLFLMILLVLKYSRSKGEDYPIDMYAKVVRVQANRKKIKVVRRKK